MLANRSTPVLTTADDASMPIHQLGQEIDILIVDIHRSRSLALDKQRIFLLDLGPCSGSLARRFLGIGRSTGKGHACL